MYNNLSTNSTYFNDKISGEVAENPFLGYVKIDVAAYS